MRGMTEQLDRSNRILVGKGFFNPLVATLFFFFFKTLLRDSVDFCSSSVSLVKMLLLHFVKTPIRV